MFWTSSKLPTKHLKIQSLFQNYTTKRIYIIPIKDRPSYSYTEKTSSSFLRQWFVGTIILKKKTNQ
ncbi:hypothetical protein LEP1GSC040_0636 [Leptospira santarosai str. 2000030832]|nr:hypothetical protein LEP1GSC040_0636 [Leptospira santarosai str. 2000030832]